MSRQRLRPSLGESSHMVCPRCNGMGSIRSVESLALSILRLIGEEARKDRTARIIAQLPVDVATYLMNEKRDWLRNTEDKTGVDIVLVPNPHIQTPEYSIRRVRDDEAALPEHNQVSYQMPAAPVLADPTLDRDKPAAEAPAVAPFMPATPAPIVAAPPHGARAAGPTGRPRRAGGGAAPRGLLGAPQGLLRRRGGGHRRDRRKPRTDGRAASIATAATVMRHAAAARVAVTMVIARAPAAMAIAATRAATAGARRPGARATAQ